MTDTDTAERVEDTESAKYDNGNDQQILNRLDGPFASAEKVQEAIEKAAHKIPTKLATVNELYEPLVPIPDRFNPKQFVAVPEKGEELPEYQEPEKDEHGAPKAHVENPDPEPGEPDPVTGRPATEKAPDTAQETHETKEAREELGKAHDRPEHEEHEEHEDYEGDDPDAVEEELGEAEDEGDIEKTKPKSKKPKSKR
jgi:hypothetical protein